MMYVVTHRGYLNVEEWIASHSAGTLDTPNLCETLVDAGPEDIEAIKQMENVISVEPAQPGLFYDDEEGAVRVYPDGSWKAAR